MVLMQILVNAPKFICLLALVAIVSCVKTGSQSSVGKDVSDQTPSQKDIVADTREPNAGTSATSTPTDEFFLNFRYPWVPDKKNDYFKRSGAVSLLNGKLSEDKANGSDEYKDYDVRVEQHQIDLTGDGKDETIISLSIGLPDRSYPSCLFVFSRSGSKPQLIWQYEGGKYDVKGFKSFYKNETGQLIVEEFDISDSPLCCPKAFIRSRFDWNNGTFVLVDETTIPHDGNRLNR